MLHRLHVALYDTQLKRESSSQQAEQNSFPDDTGEKLNSSGSDVSQLEALLSCAKSMARCRGLETRFLRAEADVLAKL